MKTSIYNTIISIGGKYLIYNPYRNMCLVVATRLMESLKDDENTLKNTHPLFYSQLVKIGYFVEDKEDEIILLKERISRTDTNNKQYLLTINPTVNCNFKCWYCYEKHIPKSKMNDDVMKRTKLFISNVTKKTISLESFHLGFFGGEPLLYFKDVVLPIMEHYNRCCRQYNIKTYIGFTTNGYLINDTMIDELKKNNVTFFQITLDGCRYSHDATRFPSKGKGSYDKIIRNIKRLAENQFKVLIRINYTAENIERVIEIGDDIQDILPENKKNVTINFQRVWQDRNRNEDIEKMIGEHIEICREEFNGIGFRSTTVIHDFVRNSCYADKTNQILIHYNGDLYKCTARDFNESNKVGYLSENGELVLDPEKANKRSTIRFTKSACHQCRIAPLCGGGCSQRHIEQLNRECCLLGYNEKDKDDVILDYFYNGIVLPNEIPDTSST